MVTMNTYAVGKMNFTLGFNFPTNSIPSDHPSPVSPSPSKTINNQQTKQA
jgi:hypothetical protein